MKNIKKIVSLSITDMENLAVSIAGLIGQGDIITLRGDLGSGKTTFARALIKSLLLEDIEVTSPTFNLMQSYDTKLGLLWHLDLYRIENVSEAYQLGLEELWHNIVLIEWAERIENLLPIAKRLDISFEFGDNQDSRNLVFSGSEDWEIRFGFRD